MSVLEIDYKPDNTSYRKQVRIISLEQVPRSTCGFIGFRKRY